ncbi:MAG: hypothetical protein AAGD10_02795 [Myxococcota bacterium]
MMPEGFSRETSIRRTEEGLWFHDGEPVEHPGVRRAFDGWIDRAEDGRYILRNEVNWAYVEVEGAPVFVLHARADQETVRLQLGDHRTENLDFDSLRQDVDGFLYCSVREGRLTAKFTRDALFDLDGLWVEDEDGQVAIRWRDRIHPIPVTEEPVR